MKTLMEKVISGPRLLDHTALDPSIVEQLTTSLSQLGYHPHSGHDLSPHENVFRDLSAVPEDAPLFREGHSPQSSLLFFIHESVAFLWDTELAEGGRLRRFLMEGSSPGDLETYLYSKGIALFAVRDVVLVSHFDKRLLCEPTPPRHRRRHALRMTLERRGELAPKIHHSYDPEMSPVAGLLRGDMNEIGVGIGQQGSRPAAPGAMTQMSELQESRAFGKCAMNEGVYDLMTELLKLVGLIAEMQIMTVEHFRIFLHIMLLYDVSLGQIPPPIVDNLASLMPHDRDREWLKDTLAAVQNLCKPPGALS